jgi:hypothetical protein
VNEQYLLPILLVIVALLIVAGAFLAWRLERKRREALAREAARLGLSFAPERSPHLARQYETLRGLHEGGNRYAFDVLQGQYRGQPVTLFDFHHETHSSDSKGHRQTHHHYQQVALLHLGREFPNLLLGPEGIFSKIAQAFGYDDIDFESHEFSRRFCVRSQDKRFAYDFCNAAMIEFLLDRPDVRLEVQGRVLAFVSDGRLNPADIEAKLDRALAIHERMPAYLFAA